MAKGIIIIEDMPNNGIALQVHMDPPAQLENYSVAQKVAHEVGMDILKAMRQNGNKVDVDILNGQTVA